VALDDVRRIDRHGAACPIAKIGKVVTRRSDFHPAFLAGRAAPVYHNVAVLPLSRLVIAVSISASRSIW
jgi:hypothetical protein